MLSPGFTLHLTWLLKQYLLLSFFVVGAARDAPQNLRDLYDAIRAKRQCSNELATGFYSKSSGSNSMFPNPTSTRLTLMYCPNPLSTH